MKIETLYTIAETSLNYDPDPIIALHYTQAKWYFGWSGISEGVE